MLVSCAFTPTLATPDHITLAERLGYQRAWCYDSPALYCDVWMTLAAAAQRTVAIGLGPGVLVPHLRHPMTNAAAVATLEALAPGRVAVAVGTGFTATGALGHRPMPWEQVIAYVKAMRALLQGEDVMWDGRLTRMLHPIGVVPPRPMDVPFIVAASGPKGVAAARGLGAGIFLGPRPVAVEGFTQAAALITGTVLEPGEDPAGERVMAAAGHGAAVWLHACYERPDALARVPRGLEWKAMVDDLPAATRHLLLHELHHTGVNERDLPFVSDELLARYTYTAVTLQQRLTHLAQLGVTEVVYQPAGPDIPRELEVFVATFMQWAHDRTAVVEGE
ncbi:MAG: LLM class flavin-dependent oxidoreductase [Actinomycetota bacterium]